MEKVRKNAILSKFDSPYLQNCMSCEKVDLTCELPGPWTCNERYLAAVCPLGYILQAAESKVPV